jgi:hypothetical protein
LSQVNHANIVSVTDLEKFSVTVFDIHHPLSDSGTNIRSLGFGDVFLHISGEKSLASIKLRFMEGSTIAFEEANGFKV